MVENKPTGETATSLKQTAKMNLTELRAEAEKVGIEVPEKTARGWLLLRLGRWRGPHRGSLRTLPRVDVPQDPGGVPGVGHGEERKRVGGPEETGHLGAKPELGGRPGSSGEERREALQMHQMDRQDGPETLAVVPPPQMGRRESFLGIPPTGLERPPQWQHAAAVAGRATPRPLGPGGARDKGWMEITVSGADRERIP